MKPIPFAFLFALSLSVISCQNKKSATTAAKASNENVPLSSAGAGAYVLAKKNHLAPVGTVETTISSMEMEEADLRIIGGQQEIEGTATQTGEGNETIEVLAPDKIRRVLVSKKSNGKMVINDNEQATPEKIDALVGKSTVLTLKDGNWTAVIDGVGTPDSAQQKSLDRVIAELERDSDFEMYGDTARKPGDKWDVDPAKLMNFGDAQNVSGTYSVEFVSVEDFAGSPCAVLKANFEIKGKTGDGKDGPVMDLRFKGEATTHRSIADLADLNVDVNGTMTITGSPAPTVEMEIEGPAKISQKMMIKKP